MDYLSKWLPFLKRKLEKEENNSNVRMKRMRFDFDNKLARGNEDVNFMETMKKILACSICFDVASHTKQCKNGHLLCTQCVVRMQQTGTDFSCPVCRCSLKNGLMRSLIAEQLMMELPAICKFCAMTMTAKDLKKHEKHMCKERDVHCKYAIFGCDWEGKANTVESHAEACQYKLRTVESVETEVNLYAKRMQEKTKRSMKQWWCLIDKIKESSNNYKCSVFQVILHRRSVPTTSSPQSKQICFRSTGINHPKACCRRHGWVIEFILSTEPLRCEYRLHNESKKKHKAMFFITAINFDDHRIHVVDQLHALQFSRTVRETGKFELDMCGAAKHIETLKTTELIEADLCVFMEAEPEISIEEDEEEEEEGDATTASPGNILLALLSSNVSSTEPNAEAEPENESSASEYSELNEDVEEPLENPTAAETPEE